MLPDINANNWGVREERILVGGGDDLKTLGGCVDALDIRINCSSSHIIENLTSQPHPEPWIPAVVVLNSFLKLSNEPNEPTIASFKGPLLSTPPFPPFSFEGAKFFQNKL